MNKITDLIFKNKDLEKIVLEFKNKQYTLGEIDRISDIVCNALCNKGLSNSVLVYYGDKTPEYVFFVLGAWKAGSCFIPLDKQLPKDRVLYILENSCAKACFSDEKIEGVSNFFSLGELFENTSCFSKNNEINNNYEVKNDNKANQNYKNDLAYIIYTSGSTGKPKGVEISYDALFSFLTNIKENILIRKEDVFLSITTISFDISIMELFLPLVVGCKLIIATRREQIDFKKLGKTIEDKNVSIMQATPITWEMLLGEECISKNITILCGGEALENSLAQKMLNVSSNVYNLYGPTETTIWTSVKKIEKSEDISIGSPMQNAEYYIFDEEMKIADEGELYIGGECLANGYRNNPALTSDRFILNPIDKKRIYKTGDLVKKENDNYYYLGRNDFQIKLNGHRIELEEIEKNINAIEGVSKCIVVPDKMTRTLIAFYNTDVEIKNETDFEEKTRKQIDAFLPDYMVPNYFYHVDTFPMTFNNKIDKKKLLEDFYKTKESGDVKEKLLKIWKKYVDKDANFDTPFNEVFMDSLETTKMCVDICMAGAEISFGELLRLKTINNILGSKNGAVLNQNSNLLNYNIQAELEKRDLHLSSFEIRELNSSESMMLTNYMINRESLDYYEFYVYDFQNEMPTFENIEKEFIKAFSKLKTIHTIYIFNKNGASFGVYSDELNLICTQKVIFESLKQLDDFSNDITNKPYDINKNGITFYYLKSNDKVRLLITYHHIRMDGNTYYDCLALFFKSILKTVGNSKKNLENNNSLRISKDDTSVIDEYCNSKKIRKGSLMQKIVSDVLKISEFCLVIQNIPRKSENDISIIKVYLKNDKIEDDINVAIENKSEIQKHKENDTLFIVNNKDEIYEILDNYSIKETHIEKNGFNKIVVINLQPEIEVLLYDYSESPIDRNIFYEKILNKIKEIKDEYLSN